MPSKRKREEPLDVLAQWLERDLTEEADDGRIYPAFEVEDLLAQASDLLAADRFPILVGESGIGKTAVINEMARLAQAGEGHDRLRGRRIVQLSFRRRAAALADPQKMRPAMQELIEALLELGADVVPFFRDIDAAYELDLEALLQVLGYRHPGVILGEGSRTTVDAMFECSPELEQHYSVVLVEEPSLGRTKKIMTGWASELDRRYGTKFDPNAIDQALQLSHRFLARTRLPRKSLELLARSAGQVEQERPIECRDVFDCFCRQHRVPRSLIDPDENLAISEVESLFHENVLGQEDAVRAVISMLSVLKAGLSDVRRPFGAFLFAGPTGVGKTHVAQLLAEWLFGSRERMVRINMADFQGGGADGDLFGHKHGNANAQRGVLTRRLMGHPFSVLLLDEFEKSDPLVHDRFLQLLDEGCFINGLGENISCRSSIIIATTNAGAEVYRGQSLGFSGAEQLEERRRELERRMNGMFRFELLNRFDQVVHFTPLSRADIRTIAVRELEALERRAGLAQRELSLEVDESVLDWLVAHGHDPDHGARFLRRTMERHVTTALADAIVRENPPAGSRLLLLVRGGRVSARSLSDAPGLEVSRTSVSLPHGSEAKAQTLDIGGLQDVARELIKAAAPLRAGLEENRAELSRLLELMNQPDFWDRADREQAILEPYRELDVLVQGEQRWARRLDALELALAEEQHPGKELERLARCLEEAAEAYREWQMRQAEAGPSSLWLVVSSGNPLKPVGDWLESLATMELAWCRRLGLGAAVAAEVVVEGRLARVVLDVEGPGASTLLAMEAGLHRLVVKPRKSARARIEIIPRTAVKGQAWPGLSSARRRTGTLGLQVSARCRLDLQERGLSIEFEGAHQEQLSQLMQDLRAAWSRPRREEAAVARVYGEDGDVARDPRTDAVTPRLREVLKGRLDSFLDAWRRHEQGAAEGAGE